MLLFCFLATVGRRLIRNSGVFHRAVLKVGSGAGYGMLRHGLWGAVKPLNRIPILCTASILYLFIIGRNLSTKQILAAARHAGREECGQVPPLNAIWNAIRIAPWHPFSSPCWRCTYLPVLTLECSAWEMQ